MNRFERYFNTKKIIKRAVYPFIRSEKKRHDFNHWYTYTFSPGFIPQMTFRVADGCNLRCKMCHFSMDYRKGKPITYMDMDLFRKAIDESIGLVDVVGFSGSSEPLLHPEIDKMVAYASRAGMRTKIGTNGTLLTGELSEKLLTAGLNKLKVSVDGATAETYEKIRVGANFEKLRRNIKDFYDLRNRLGKRTKIHINTVISNDNIHETTMIKNAFKEIGDIFGAKYPCTFGVMSGLQDYSPVNLIQRKCLMLADIMTIIPDGRALICCGDNQNLGVIGDVTNSRPIDIWLSEEYKKLRRYHLKGELDKIPLCKNCKGASPEDKKKLMKTYLKG